MIHITSLSRPQPIFINNMKCQVSMNIIVHCIRHAKAQHKPVINVTEDIRDPDLREQGVSQCKTFASWFSKSSHPKHIKCILCSPLTRCLNTALLAFEHILSEVKIFAVPELQTFDKAAPGVGLDLPDLQQKYKDERSIDVTTFGRPDWNNKQEGRWSVEGKEQSIDFVRGLLEGMGSTTTAVANGGWTEVVLVSHRSFLKELIEDDNLLSNPGMSPQYYCTQSKQV